MNEQIFKLSFATLVATGFVVAVLLGATPGDQGDNQATPKPPAKPERDAPATPDTQADNRAIDWHRTAEAAFGAGRKSGRPVYLFFTGEGCAPCARIKQHVHTDPRVVAELNEHWEAYRGNVSCNRPLRERWRIHSIPQELAADSKNQRHIRDNSLTDPDRYLERLRRWRAKLQNKP